MINTGGFWEARIDTALGGNWVYTLTDSGGTYGSASITAGQYYLSTAGSGAAGLVSTLQTSLNATSTPDGYTVSLSLTTGLITIAKSSGTFSITFGGTTGLRRALGFTDDISTGTSATATTQSPALWIPGTAYDSEFDPYVSDGYLVSDDAVVISPAGNIVSLGYNTRTENQITYRMLDAAKTLTGNESTTNASLQTFWQNAVYADAAWAERGSPLRFYPDTSDTATNTTYRVRNANSFRPARSIPGYNKHYEITLDLALNVD